METKNLRIIKVKFYGPTNNRGSRFRIYDDFRKSKYYDYDYEFNSILDQVVSILVGKGFNIIGTSDAYNDVSYIVTDTFNLDL